MASFSEFLDEHVMVEEKIATYKWLGRQMELDFASAAKELQNFYEHRKGESGLNAVYFISGVLPPGNRMLTLVRDANLEEAKRRFSSVLSCHIYSIQRCPLRNLNLLYAVDLGGDESNRVSDVGKAGISNPNVHPKSIENGLQPTAAPLPVEKPSKPANKSAPTAKSTNERTTPPKATGERAASKQSKAKNDRRPAKTDIKAMFATAAKKDTKKKEKEEGPKPTKAPPVEQKNDKKQEAPNKESHSSTTTNGISSLGVTGFREQ